MWFKKLYIPMGLKQLDSLSLWEVRWQSRHGEFHADTKPEVEVFISEEAAKEFRDALVTAFKLVKHTAGNRVSLKKVQ